MLCYFSLYTYMLCFHPSHENCIHMEQKKNVYARFIGSREFMLQNNERKQNIIADYTISSQFLGAQVLFIFPKLKLLFFLIFFNFYFRFSSMTWTTEISWSIVIPTFSLKHEYFVNAIMLHNVYKLNKMWLTLLGVSAITNDINLTFSNFSYFVFHILHIYFCFGSLSVRLFSSHRKYI